MKGKVKFTERLEGTYVDWAAVRERLLTVCSHYELADNVRSVIESSHKKSDKEFVLDFFHAVRRNHLRLFSVISNPMPREELVRRFLEHAHGDEKDVKPVLYNLDVIIKCWDEKHGRESE